MRCSIISTNWCLRSQAFDIATASGSLARSRLEVRSDWGFSLEYDQGIAALQSRARLATLASWAIIGTLVAFSSFELAEALGIITTFTMSETMLILFSIVGVAQTLAYIVSVVLVAMWIHRAHANLHDRGYEGLAFTPGWAVGWYFIPFANLVMPFKAMRELWHATFGTADRYDAPAPTDITLWWTFWIVGNIISSISTRLSLGAMDDATFRMSSTIGVVSSILTIACAFKLIGLIRDITAGQESGVGAAAAFE